MELPNAITCQQNFQVGAPPCRSPSSAVQSESILLAEQSLKPLFCLLQEFDLDDRGSVSQEALTDAMAMFEGPNRDPVA